MTPLWSMVGAAAGAALVAVRLGGAPAAEVTWGLAGPLLAACVTWVVVARTVRTAPAGLTGVMIKAFAAKMLFFAAYVAMALRGAELRPTPFVVSFTAFFIGLHVMEALLLQRLFGRVLATVHETPGP